MRAFTMNQDISNGVSRPFRRLYLSLHGGSIVLPDELHHAMTVELHSRLSNPLQQQMIILHYSDHKLNNEQKKRKYAKEIRLVQLLESLIYHRKKLRLYHVFRSSVKIMAKMAICTKKYRAKQMTQNFINFHQRMYVSSNKIKRAIQIHRTNKTLKLLHKVVNEVLERRASISRRIFLQYKQIAILRSIQLICNHSQRMITLVTNQQRKWRGKLGRRQARRFKYRLSVINEIVQTEEGYVKDLEIICHALYKEASTILKKQKLEKLFINVQVIHQYHKQLLQSLWKSIKTVKKDLGAVAVVFNEYLPYFKIYFEYCKQAPYQQSHLKSLKRQNQNFKEMLLLSTKNPQLKGLNWESFLIKPVQRLGKYELLLKDLIRHTEDNHPSKGLYRFILEQINQLLQQNDIVMQCIDYEYFKSLFREVFAEKIMEPWRRFVSEQELIILIKEQLVKTIAYFLTDLILLTTDGGTKSLKAIKLNERSFCQPVLDNLNYRYLIRIKTQDDSTLIVLENQQMQDDIHKLVQGLIYNVREKCEVRQSIIGDTSTNNQSMSVALKGTLLIKHAISEYTVYIVELVNQGISQESQIRFREIKQLEETIKRKWPQMVLPELPSKTLRVETKVIENRKLAIEDYLTSLFNQFHLLKSEDQKQILVALHFDGMTLDVEAPDELKQSLNIGQSITLTALKKNPTLERKNSKILQPETTKSLKVVVVYYKTIQMQCAVNMKISELYQNIACELNMESVDEFKFFESNSNLELLRMKPDEEKVFSDSGQSSLSLLSQTKTLIFRRVIFRMEDKPTTINDLKIQLSAHQHFHDIKSMILIFDEDQYFLITVLYLRFFQVNVHKDSIKKIIPKPMRKSLLNNEYIDRIKKMTLDLVSTLDQRIELINSHSDQAKQEYSDSISEKGKIGIILNHLVSQHPNFGVLFYDVTVSQETLKQIEQVGKSLFNSQIGIKIQLGLSFRGYHIMNKPGKMNFVIRYDESSMKVYSDQVHIFVGEIQIKLKTTQGYEIQLLAQLHNGNTT